GVDPAAIEAARGVGMTPRQQLFRVELPLAMPVIIAGVRTATVWTVGMATLSTPVGAPSLGNLIFSGLQTRNLGAVALGSLASAGLALVLDGTVRVLAWVWARGRPWMRRAAAGALVAAVVAAAVATLAGPRRAATIVGAKTFTEQYVLAEIIAGTLRDAGADVDVK